MTMWWQENLSVFINGKQRRLVRSTTEEGMDEGIHGNADPIWLLQNERYEDLYEWEQNHSGTEILDETPPVAVLEKRNSLCIGRGIYVPRQSIAVDEIDLLPIVDGLEKLEAAGPITAIALFRQNKELCRELHISTPRLLYSLIDHYYPGRFRFSSVSNGRIKPRPPAAKTETPRKPRVEKLVKIRKPRVEKALSLRNQIVEYLRQRGGACATKELRDRFVGTNCSEDALYGKSCLGDKKTIVWHTTNVIVLREALHWSAEKQAAIEDLASRHMEQRERRGIPYGSCSQILREMKNEVPEIAIHLPWTPVLLHDLLGAGERYLALGRSRDIILSSGNQHAIATLDDLALYILLHKFGGAAPTDAFIKHLREIGIIKKKLSTFVMGKDDRVILAGGWIQAVE